jgi:hypothetical protein
MKVNVKIESNLRKTGALEPPIELELKEGENTIKHVLKRLSAMYSDLILINDGKVSDDLCRLCLNGEDCFSFPEALKKTVNEGDVILIDIYLDLLAGG